jgi:hypothetical protein
MKVGCRLAPTAIQLNKIFAAVQASNRRERAKPANRWQSTVGQHRLYRPSDIHVELSHDWFLVVLEDDAVA